MRRQGCQAFHPYNLSQLFGPSRGLDSPDLWVAWDGYRTRIKTRACLAMFASHSDESTQQPEF